MGYYEFACTAPSNPHYGWLMPMFFHHSPYCWLYPHNIPMRILFNIHTYYQWEFQDPSMEVLYHKAIFCGYIRVYPLHSPYIGLIYGRYLHFRILEFPLILYNLSCLADQSTPLWWISQLALLECRRVIIMIEQVNIRYQT